MSPNGYRPWFASFRARLARPVAPTTVRADGLDVVASSPTDAGECLCFEDGTSRWLRTMQGAELG